MTKAWYASHVRPCFEKYVRTQLMLVDDPKAYRSEVLGAFQDATCASLVSCVARMCRLHNLPKTRFSLDYNLDRRSVDDHIE